MPQDLDYGEGNLFQVSYQFSRSGDFKDIYTKPTEYPLMMTNYPPLYMILSAASIKFFGISLFSMRLISLLSLIGILVVLFLALKELTLNSLISVFLCACFLFYYADFVFYIARVDMLKSFFCLLSVYLFFKKGLKNNYRLSFLCILLAVFTKHTAIIFLLSYLLIFLWRRQYRNFFSYGLLSLAVIGSLTILLNYLTRGEFLAQIIYENFSQGIVYLNNYQLIRFLKSHYLFFTLAALGGFFHRRDKAYQGLFIIFGAVFFSAAVTALKPGSWEAYFIDAFVLLIILGSGVIRSLCEDKKGLVFLLALFFTVFLWKVHSNVAVYSGAKKDSFVYNKILDYIKQEGKLSIFECRVSLGVKARGVGILDSFDYLQKLKRGSWDGKILTEGCKHIDYSIVGVGERIGQYAEFMSCLGNNYAKFQRKYLGKEIFLPKDKVEKFRQAMK